MKSKKEMETEIERLEALDKVQSALIYDLQLALTKANAENTELTALVATLADQIKGWEKYQREVNYAVENYGSYKP